MTTVLAIHGKKKPITRPLKPAVIENNAGYARVQESLNSDVIENGAEFPRTRKQVTFGAQSTAGPSPKNPTIAIPTQVGPEAPMRKSDKYHEEIWLSGALIILKGGTPNASGKWLNKLVEQAKQYRGIFTESGFPIAIFTAPNQGLLTTGKALEIPAPGRRISIVAAAHEFGHFGADKTMSRI